MGFPNNSSVGKESTCNAGDPGSIPELGRSPGEGKGYPLQYSGLENSMGYIFHGVAKSRTRLSDFHTERSMEGFKAGDRVTFLFIYLWLLFPGSSLLCIVFSPVAVSRGRCLVCCTGFSFQWLLLAWSTAVGMPVSVVMALSITCPVAKFPARGLNGSPLHWQTNSQPLDHQGSPHISVLS